MDYRLNSQVQYSEVQQAGLPQEQQYYSVHTQGNHQGQNYVTDPYQAQTYPQQQVQPEHYPHQTANPYAADGGYVAQDRGSYQSQVQPVTQYGTQYQAGTGGQSQISGYGAPKGSNPLASNLQQSHVAQLNLDLVQQVSRRNIDESTIRSYAASARDLRADPTQNGRFSPNRLPFSPNRMYRKPGGRLQGGNHQSSRQLSNLEQVPQNQVPSQQLQHPQPVPVNVSQQGQVLNLQQVPQVQGQPYPQSASNYMPPTHSAY